MSSELHTPTADRNCGILRVITVAVQPVLPPNTHDSYNATDRSRWKRVVRYAVATFTACGSSFVMSEFEAIAKVGDIAEGTGAAYAVNGRMVAVFNDGGEYRAIDDLCPHMGASLAGGHLEDGMVACPWHAWRFSICDGSWCDNPKISVDTFEVRVEGDEIQVCVPPRS